jgi:hypothetical protein
MTEILPGWIDQVQGVDFTPEKELLRDLEQWAAAHGWQVSDGKELSSALRQRTDVLLSQPERDRHLRIAVLPKLKRTPGMVRIDATSHEPFIHRIFELVYQPRRKRWRVETATVPLSDDLRSEGCAGWDWLEKLAFRP